MQADSNQQGKNKDWILWSKFILGVVEEPEDDREKENGGKNHRKQGDRFKIKYIFLAMMIVARNDYNKE